MRLDTTGYFPLKAATRIRGVMAVLFDKHDLLALEEHHEMLGAVASLMAIVVERLVQQDRAQH
jgi:hypothetical protein